MLRGSGRFPSNPLCPSASATAEKQSILHPRSRLTLPKVRREGEGSEQFLHSNSPMHVPVWSRARWPFLREKATHHPAFGVEQLENSYSGIDLG